MITESGEAPPPPDKAKTQSKYNVLDNNAFIESSTSDDEQIIMQDEINDKGETIDAEMDEFVENILQEDDCHMLSL